MLFMDIFVKSDQVFQKQSQLIRQNNLKVVFKNNAAFIIKFYEDNYPKMCEILQVEKDRGKKIKKRFVV